MGQVWAPTTAEQALEAVREAIGGKTTLELVGSGSRKAFGRPVTADAMLDLSGLTGIVSYQPEELILSVRPGTPMSEIAALLAANGQELAFEPPDFGPLWGGAAGQGTIGGCVLTGRGGPRRMSAGAPRDHCLGVKGVNGFGEAFGAGGRVVKNVTGFDLTKLIAGSFGTLCAVTELTLKVMPAAPDCVTLALGGLDDADAVQAMGRALASPASVTAAAHLPAGLAGPEARTLLRLEGFTPGIRARATQLRDLLGGAAPVTEYDRDASALIWREVGDAAWFAGDPQRVIWRLSVPPSSAATLGVLAADLGGRRFYDWGGGQLWLELPAAPDGHSARVRKALAQAVGADGHATLMRAPEAVRARQGVFQPLSPAVAALTGRVKRQFDPEGLFNPGRMYPDV
jgi:glycolate oxidase FAD binding subunit